MNKNYSRLKTFVGNFLLINFFISLVVWGISQSSLLLAGAGNVSGALLHNMILSSVLLLFIFLTKNDKAVLVFSSVIILYFIFTVRAHFDTTCEGKKILVPWYVNMLAVINIALLLYIMFKRRRIKLLAASLALAVLHYLITLNFFTYKMNYVVLYERLKEWVAGLFG